MRQRFSLCSRLLRRLAQALEDFDLVIAQRAGPTALGEKKATA